jgi:hypothetical protein
VNNLLLDTNIVSYLMRSDPLARLYGPHLANHSLAISFMTLANYTKGPFAATGVLRSAAIWTRFTTCSS